ncbi:MAG TPA: CinA family nicotinamide mononucleotide deamidase-related protein [Pirellulaceae bacterium]|jgi:nicotinamide-nucleotide amidase
MRAEIISIGDELTTGQRLDTNSQWLAERLLEIGVPVAFHTTVGDQLADNVLVFRQACERADIVVVTGGLGPTADDLTRQALADVAGVELVQDDASLAHIKALFAKRKREMPPANVVQAQFPLGSRPIFNPNGSAPGIDISISRAVGKPARVFALPGVPAEMKEMWAATVGPAIQEHIGVKKVIAHYRIKCFGVGESDLEAMLPNIIARNRYPLVGITVHQATITLRVTAEGETAEAARAAMQPTIETIHQCLGDLIFGYDDDELEDAVIDLLQDRNRTISVVELGTGGLLTRWFGALDCDESFAGGAVISDFHGASNLLSEIPPIDQPIPSEEEVVSLLASQVRMLFASSYGLAVVNTSKIVSAERATIYYALAYACETPLIGCTPLTGHPEIRMPRALKQTLNFMRLQLLGKA